MPAPVRISIASFLDYVGATPRGCVSIVKGQRSIYLDPSSAAWRFYGPFLSGLRRAVNSTDPLAVIDATVDRATLAQRRHYQTLAEGFRRWWPTTRASGVRVRDTTWYHGDLTITVRQLVGLRRPDGSTDIVLPYLKEPELAREPAELALRVLEHAAMTALPGATPVLVDMRRGRAFRLRRNHNRADLDGLLAAEAAKYVAHWHAAA